MRQSLFSDKLAWQKIIIYGEKKMGGQVSYQLYYCTTFFFVFKDTYGQTTGNRRRQKNKKFKNKLN